MNEQAFSTDLPAPGRHIFGVDFHREGVDDDHQPHGTATLHVDDQPVAQGPMTVMAIQFSLCGEGLTIGYDGGDSVSPSYPNHYAFTGGTVTQVVFDVSDGTYVEAETQLASLMARD